jgi:hypothetical protein
VENLPHRFDAVTDLLDLFETVRGAERLARNMGDPHHTNSYDTPGGLGREERLAGVLAVGNDLLTTAILMTFAIEDILDGQSVVWIGSDRSARTLLHYIPEDRVNDLLFFSPGSKEDRACPTSWNLLKDTPPDARYLVAEAVTAAFGSIYQQFWGRSQTFSCVPRCSPIWMPATPPSWGVWPCFPIPVTAR